MDYKHLSFTRDDKVGILSIARPDALNALNIEVLEELDAAIDTIEKDEDIYVVVLTGEGKAFVAGADIGEMKDMTPQEAQLFSRLGSDIFSKIETMDKPIIAAVNGFALGGGFELAMACDIILASERAKFGQPEVGLGITPGFGGTQRLSRIAGVKKAKELIFTGTIIGAEEAYKIGVVNKILKKDELLTYAVEMAKTIASNGQIAVRYSKRAINYGIEVDLETGSAIEIDLFALCFANRDQKEGMTAFLEKRKPCFEN